MDTQQEIYYITSLLIEFAEKLGLEEDVYLPIIDEMIEQEKMYYE